MSLTSEDLYEIVDDLQSIDFGLAKTIPSAGERQLRLLEELVNELADEGINFTEGVLAVRTFLTDPDTSRTYLYGPTDVGDGVGLIEKLKALAHEVDYPAE